MAGTRLLCGWATRMVSIPAPGRGLAVPGREGQRPQGRRPEAQESGLSSPGLSASPSPDPMALKQDPGNCEPEAWVIRVSRAGTPPRGAFLEDVLGTALGSGTPGSTSSCCVLLIPARRASSWWARGLLWRGDPRCPCPRAESLWRTRLSPKAFRTDAPDPSGDLLSRLACRWAPRLSRGRAAVPVVGMATRVAEAGPAPS